jgi:hypothetical protein
VAKLQRRFKVGAAYTVKGPGKLERKLKCVARTKISGKEVLMFQIQRKARKTKKKS